MDADGGWKKTLRNFGIEAKRAAERTTVQAMSRMGLSNAKAADPDPQFEQLTESHASQTTALKAVRDAATSIIEALARVSGAGSTLASAIHGALGAASASGSAVRSAENHVSAQATIRDGALRRGERRLHSRVISPIEDELERAREIVSALDQRRKVASDYRRYRARLDEFSGNENSEDAVKADDKLRELQVLAESLSDAITTAIPRRAELLERCAQECAEVLRDFHVEAASALDAAVGTNSANSSQSSSATDLRQRANASTSSTANPDLFGTPLSDHDPPAPEKRTARTKAPSMWDRDEESLLDQNLGSEKSSVPQNNATRRSKSAYVPVKQSRGSIWDEEESPRQQPLHQPQRSPSPPPVLNRRRGDSSSGYPTGGVGQRESTGLSTSSSREEASSYPSSGVGQKSSVYPTRRVPTTRPRPTSTAPKQSIPRSSSRESGISGKNPENRFPDDLLGSFGMADPPVRLPRQRKSTGSSVPQASSSTGNLDDLLNFGSSSTTSQQSRTAAAAEGDLLGTFSARPSRGPPRARHASSSPPPSGKPETRSNTSGDSNLNRAALEKKHEAEIKARAAEKLAAVREREAANAREREKKDDARSAIERKINQWTGNGARRGNLRALLASLDTVLYPGNTWKPVSMDVLKAPAKVKLNYRKAILQVHPDKIGPKNLPPDQQVLAELIFDELQNGNEVFTAEQEGKPPPPGSVGPKNAKPGASPGGFGMGNPAAGMYNNMGRGGMGGMNGMGGMGMGGMGNMRNQGMGGMGMGGMGGMNMGRGMGMNMNMNGMGGRGMNMNGFGNMYGAQQNGRGTGNMPFGTGRAYGMGMNQQQRR